MYVHKINWEAERIHGIISTRIKHLCSQVTKTRLYFCRTFFKHENLFTQKYTFLNCIFTKTLKTVNKIIFNNDNFYYTKSI